MATNTNLQSTEEQSTAERARQEAARVGETAKQEAGQVIEDAKQQGRQLVTEAGERIKQEAAGQAQRASENLRSLSSEFRRMAESSQDQGNAASWVRMGADRMESLADRLDSGGLEGLMRDVGDFARKNPTTFLAVTFGAGLLAGRLVKNTDMNQVTSGSTESGMAPQTGSRPAPTGGLGQTGTGQMPSQSHGQGTESLSPGRDPAQGVGS